MLPLQLDGGARAAIACRGKVSRVFVRRRRGRECVCRSDEHATCTETKTKTCERAVQRGRRESKKLAGQLLPLERVLEWRSASSILTAKSTVPWQGQGPKAALHAADGVPTPPPKMAAWRRSRTPRGRGRVQKDCAACSGGEGAAVEGEKGREDVYERPRNA
jgi:hypothetical protein